MKCKRVSCRKFNWGINLNSQAAGLQMWRTTRRSVELHPLVAQLSMQAVESLRSNDQRFSHAQWKALGCVEMPDRGHRDQTIALSSEIFGALSRSLSQIDRFDFRRCHWIFSL